MGRKPRFPPGTFRSSSPGDRTLGTLRLVSPAHPEERGTARGVGYPTRRLSLKAERDGLRRVGMTQRGCRRGMEGGAPWGGQPQAAPAFPRLEDSPLEKVILASASRPGAPRHDKKLPPQAWPSPCTPPTKRQLPSLFTPSAWHYSRPLQGQFPSLSAPARGHHSPLRQSGVLRQPHRPGFGKGREPHALPFPNPTSTRT